MTEATLRILHKPEGALPVLIGFNSNEIAGQCVSNIIKAGILPVAIEFMDRPCIEATETFSGAGYPDCEALLIVEVEGSLDEIDEQIDKIMVIAKSLDPTELRRAKDEDQQTVFGLGESQLLGQWAKLQIICALTVQFL